LSKLFGLDVPEFYSQLTAMLCGWDSASALSVVLLQGHPARENVITEEFFSQQVEEGNPGELAHLGYS